MTNNKKNYIIYFLLILITIILTLFFSTFYKNRVSSNFTLYKYLSEIKDDELNQFLTENPDILIYISDPSNSNNDIFEMNFKKKIDDLNIRNNVVYMDSTNNKTLSKIEKMFDISIDKKNSLLIIVSDKKLIYYSEVSNDFDIESINFEVLK